MRPISLASLALLAVVAMATAQAQTAAQPAAAPAAAAPAASSSSGGKLSHECKDEVKKACGRAHGTEMQDCVKSSLDLNKFSASCATQLKQQAAAKKPSG
jgi:opacity protein-like surface antigen